MSVHEERFAFGKNWSDYVAKYFSEERLRIAQGHLLEFLKLDHLRGYSFLDIGCGSGLHSLAAWRAGASRVFSFDYDHQSVTTSKRLWEMTGRPENWRIEHGSVLDEAYVSSLEQADIVYSWGVLHHTGDMWKALALASRPLKPNGVFYVALYSKEIYSNPSWEYWLELKRTYNRAGTLRKRLMEWQYAWRATIKSDVLAMRNPWRTISDYQRSRGMSYWTDIRDWLGGWPMEFAGNMETTTYCRDSLLLELINVSAGEGNTEYLFRRAGTRNYWDNFLADKPLVPLRGPFTHVDGYAWKASLHLPPDLGDDIGHQKRSNLMVYENDIPLGFAHQPLSEISARGCGRYLHLGNELIFSATDSVGPNENGRRYTYRVGSLYSEAHVEAHRLQ
jgi:SAM-dependent methyltransferase